jgi:neutral ceramidase
MLVGFGRERLDLPIPFDVQGYAARDQGIESVDPRLSVTAVFLRSADARVVLVSVDALAHTAAFADTVRARIADVAGCDPSAVLLAATHSHASVWPNRSTKISGASLDAWTLSERQFLEQLPDVYTRAAEAAADSARTARVSWGRGRANGLAANRRERLDDGSVIIGVDPKGLVDDAVRVLRFDAPDGDLIGTIVSFACHPVVLGPTVARANPDYVGPLREMVEDSIGGLCLFLQGASGDIQPIEALQDVEGTAAAFGRRIGLEAVHAAIDQDPWPKTLVRTLPGRWTPTAVYRRLMVEDMPEQPLRVGRASIQLNLAPPGPRDDLLAELERFRGERQATSAGGAITNGLDNQIRWLTEVTDQAEPQRTVNAELWGARIGDGVILGISAEPFTSIGLAIQAAFPSHDILVVGCCGPVLGYLPDAAAYAAGGFEVDRGHRIYGLPAAVEPGSDSEVIDAAINLINELTA